MDTLPKSTFSRGVWIAANVPTVSAALASGSPD
jgi:hypothetical protein